MTPPISRTLQQDLVSSSFSKSCRTSAAVVTYYNSVPIWMAVLILVLPAYLPGTVLVCPPLLEITPTCPGINASSANSFAPPIQPIKAFPGLMSPSEPGLLF